MEGSGCFEVYASMKRLKDKIAKKLNISENLSGEIVFERAKKNQKEVEPIIEEFAKNLAEGIANIVNIFEPEAICIGGSYTYHTDILEEKVKKALKEVKTYNNQMPEITLAQFQNDSGIIGATLL